jgi:hypothetical protein
MGFYRLDEALTHVSSNRPIFNFFADLGERVVAPFSTDDSKPDTAQQMTIRRTSYFSLGLASIAALTSVLVVLAALHKRQQDVETALFEGALFSVLSEQLNQVSTASNAVPISVGKIQSVDFNDRAAIVQSQDNKTFPLKISGDTHVFLYLPSVKHLIPVKPGWISLSRNDLVAFAYDRSTGEATDMVYSPARSEKVPIN